VRAISDSTHADRTQVRVNFLDGNNQLQQLDVLKAAVVFVKCAGFRSCRILDCVHQRGSKWIHYGSNKCCVELFPVL
jgi:hypothetical protein